MMYCVAFQQFSHNSLKTDDLEVNAVVPAEHVFE